MTICTLLGIIHR